MTFTELADEVGHLTHHERLILRLLFGQQPGNWWHAFDVIQLAWDASYCNPDGRHMLRVNVHRIRRKLEGTRWQIQNRTGFYRLVMVERAAA